MKLTIECETDEERAAIAAAGIPEAQEFDHLVGFILVGLRGYPGGGFQTLDRHHNGADLTLTGAAVTTVLRLIFGHPTPAPATRPPATPEGGDDGRDTLHGG